MPYQYQDPEFGFSAEFPDGTPEPQIQQSVVQARQHFARQQQLYDTLGWMGQAVSGFRQQQQQPMIPSKAAAAAMGPQAFQQNVAGQQQQIQFQQQQQQEDRIEQERMRLRDKEILQRQKDERNRFTIQKNQYDLQQKHQQFLEKQAADKLKREEKEAEQGTLHRGAGGSLSNVVRGPNGEFNVTPIINPTYPPRAGSGGTPAGAPAGAPKEVPTGTALAYMLNSIKQNNPGATPEQWDAIAVSQGLPKGMFVVPAQTPEDRQYEVEDIFLRAKEAIGDEPWFFSKEDETYRTRMFNWMTANGASADEASVLLDREKVWDDLNPWGFGKGNGPQIGQAGYTDPSAAVPLPVTPPLPADPQYAMGEQDVAGEQSVHVSTMEEAYALPPGTIFIDPDGVERRR